MKTLIKKVTTVVITITIITLTFSLKAQTFSHSLGAGILLGEEGGGFGSIYSPRINILQVGEGMTTSIGTHFALALNTQDEGSSTSQSFIGIELPIMLELNLGANSHPNNNNSFGGFLGIGYGFSSLSQADPGEVMVKGVFYNAGLRFKGDWGIKLAYLENFNPNIFGGASIVFQWNIN